MIKRNTSENYRNGFHRSAKIALLAILLWLPLQSTLKAMDDTFDPEGSPGSLLICGGGNLPPEIREKFVELAGGKQARIVVIPTANIKTDWIENFDFFLEPWKNFDITSLHILHSQDRNQSNQDAVSDLLRQATGIWISGGIQLRLADRYLGTNVEREIVALRARGGIIGGTSAGAAIMSHVMIADGFHRPQFGEGFDLFPDAIVDQHFSQRNRWQRLVSAVEKNPQRLGVGIDEQTALLVRGRRAEVLGSGRVMFLISANAQGKSHLREFVSGDMLDVTSWRRAARNAPMLEQLLLANLTPKVHSGSLVLSGRGDVPESAAQKFLELAGGPESPIVILRADPSDEVDEPLARALQPFSPKHVVVLNPRNKEEVNRPETLEALRQARAVWFGTGEQWKWIDLYEGTEALPLIRQVLERGGVIGGNAASAGIQSECLLRANPLGQADTLALGYERGFNFLPGTAVTPPRDSQEPFAELLSVVQRFPRMQGVGIDDATALIVHGSTGEVVGKGNVHVCDAGANPTEQSASNYKMTTAEVTPVVWHRVGNGERYDFENRKVLAISSTPEQE